MTDLKKSKILKKVKPCVSCFYPNEEKSEACEHCGVVFKMVDGTDPLQNLVAEGKVYAKATEIKPNKLVLIGTWLLFLPAFLFSLFFAVSLILNDIGGGLQSFVMFWILVGVAFFSFKMLTKITVNYNRTNLTKKAETF